jgi:hypothetical protein
LLENLLLLGFFLVLLDAVVDVLFKLSALLVAELFQIKFKGVALIGYAVFDDFIDTHELVSVEEVDVVAERLSLLNSHHSRMDYCVFWCRLIHLGLGHYLINHSERRGFIVLGSSHMLRREFLF